MFSHIDITHNTQSHLAKHTNISYNKNNTATHEKERKISAFLHHPEHINVIVWSVMKYRKLNGSSMIYDVPGFTRPLDLSVKEDKDLVGKILYQENLNSIIHRYGDDVTEEERKAVENYRYSSPRDKNWSISEILLAIQSLHYQSCEHPEWEESAANYILKKIQDHLNYYQTEGCQSWEINDSSVSILTQNW